ncbi:MAG TPA: sulfur transferase domain-containing protein [Bryobacteraceae bacterium]|nr:sulfur transferase domain-containing protein [Bryobacteraceae bacterium]
MKRLHLVFAMVTMGAFVAAAQTQVKKSAIEGITNFAQVETTVACAGAVSPSAVAGIKKMGFASIINLRLDTEKGADIDAEAAAAQAAGIHFVHLPLNGNAPDPAVADRFLKVITEPGNQPALIHCASGNRAAAMWLIKRVLIDKWDNERALEEATQLGSISPVMKTFALEYIQAHKK